MAEDGDDPVGRAMMIAGASRLPEEPTTANVLDQMPKWGGLKSYLPDSVRDALATAADYRDRVLSNVPPAAMLAANFVSPGVRTPVRVANPIRAYHGSPHDFDAFDLSKIGTGEGAQAYGHGLYFAENEPVARQYRDQLAHQNINMSGGSLFVDKPWMAPDAKFAATSAVERAQSEGLMGDAAVKRAQESLHQQMLLTKSGTARQYYQDGLNALHDLIGKDWEAGKGKMYEVALHASPEQFLDWDKPFGGQSRQVQGAIRDIVSFHGLRRSNIPGYEPKMGEMISALEGKGGKDFASGEFQDAGIPGIRYADQLSRGNRIGPSTPANDIARDWLQGHGGDRQKAIADLEDFLRSRKQDPATNDVLNALKNWGGPTHNYVVWSPEIIEILRKYGILGPAALAAMGSVTGKQTEE